MDEAGLFSLGIGPLFARAVISCKQLFRQISFPQPMHDSD